MGKCKYCGQDAGFFRSQHAECEQSHQNGIARIMAILAGCFERKEDFYLHQNELQAICREAFVTDDICRQIYCRAFDAAIEQYLDDGIIDNDEERTVARFMQFTGLPQHLLNANKSLEKVVQSKVLQELLNGQVPTPRITISGSFPFLLSKNEHMLWLFRNVTLQMQKVRRETVGRTRGVSVRICKGVYYRTGGFRGHPIETTYMQRIGTGSVCLTDKNLYFHSPEKSLKIPFSKILSLDPYSNGLGVQKDGANDKPIFFQNLNSWFCYNVISNLK
ncbi:MAG: hypothetical protein K2G78_07240 [Muribaculaceae bacterium]|nr:hypothetical protein [Muribaculaceae bacterium]